MSYSIDEIKISNKIYYYLLKNGQLDENEEELYRAYSDNENITLLVKEMGEASETIISKYGGIVYIIPKEENDFLGYSKGELKKILCKSTANDKDYYLSQFIILTLMVNLYGAQGISSKSRDYIKIGEFLNIITDKLTEGANREKQEDDKLLVENHGGSSEKNFIVFQDLLDRFEALKSSDIKTTAKTTKEGFIDTILKFLEDEGLIYYIKNDDIIKSTTKLDSFMDWDLLNKNNYNRALRALGEAMDE
ncbi:hypothetical protein SAMN02745248_00351 [Hathewaya proteolytica DSM 3090]|uniref:Uncharacterized protein n=1 Tax=Hathewaya proteolytica DSM 3090 TaxID=1121331 RepID=A0A1M6K682_9CLOT|nr:DUF6063 family protein [Hathewaya proteolytica]SHJ54492.1 hypothetical protein SAMN02745248_00351 [Hathewaya proteolytica DSM 3090]